MERLYAWTPDEATLEFYSESKPNIFTSKHIELDNLQLPPWCKTTRDFISYHRRLLESQHVSERLHSWIDLTFGVALAGERAVLEKNVVLHHVKWNPIEWNSKNQCSGDCISAISETSNTEKTMPDENCRSMFVQLFMRPHPKRIENSSQIHLPHEQIMQYPSINGDSDTLLARKQHDVSMIGALVQECYNSARVIPDERVQEAVQSLLCGKIDLTLSLQNLDTGSELMNENIFPFPSDLKHAYDFFSSTQSNTLTRNELNDLVNDYSYLTIRSTRLEKVWHTIKSLNAVRSLSVSSCGLLLPTLLAPLDLRSVRCCLENYYHGREYASFADKLRDYIIQLSTSVPGDLLLPDVFKFFAQALKHAHNHSVLADAIGRLMLDEDLIATMYKHSSWESFIQHTSIFVTSQLNQHAMSNESLTEKAKLQTNSIVGYFITFLARDCSLGASICSRYIIPLLIYQVEKYGSSDASSMAVNVLRSLVPFLESDVIGIIVIKPVMKLVWQKLSDRHTSEGINSSTISSYADTLDNFPLYLLRELIALLHVCLSQMESNIDRYYFHATPLCMSQMLLFSFKALVHHHEAPEAYDKAFKETCFLVRSMVTQAQEDIIHTHENLMLTIEALCSEVNNEYLDLSMKHRSGFKEEAYDDEQLLSLPGMADTYMLAKDAIKVFDHSLLCQKCPSAIELVAWVDSGKKRDCVLNKDPDDARIREKSSSVDTLDDVEGKSTNNFCGVEEKRVVAQSKEPEDFCALLSDQIVGDEAIEMLAPRRSSQEDTDGSDDENVTTNQQRELDSIKKRSFEPLPIVEQSFASKQKRDLAWAIGVRRLLDQDRIEYHWQPRMMATTSLSTESSDQSITAIATNKAESLLVAGNNLGEIMMYDLRRHPPSLTHHAKISQADSNKPIAQVAFLNTSGILVCNGGLHLWDAELGTTTSSISSKNSFLCEANQRKKPWKTADFTAFSICPATTSSNEILHSGAGEIAAITSNHLYMIDLRCSTLAGYRQIDVHGNDMVKHLEWYVSTAPPDIELHRHQQRQKKHEHASQVSSFQLNAIVACGGWVCVGSSSGHIHCFDRRQSKLLFCWKAHLKSIEYLQAVSGQILLSVSADKTAVMWNLSHNPPQQMNSIYSK